MSNIREKPSKEILQAHRPQNDAMEMKMLCNECGRRATLVRDQWGHIGLDAFSRNLHSDCIARAAARAKRLRNIRRER